MTTKKPTRKKKTSRASSKKAVGTPRRKTAEEFAKSVEESETIKALRRENRKLRNKVTNVGSAGNLVMAAIEEVFQEDPNFRIQTPSKDKRRSKPEEIAIAHVSDTQIGKITESYDSAIAEERILEYTRDVIDIVKHRRSGAKVDRIHVYLGGDMIEGEQIFPHQPHTIDSSVFDQACKTSPSIFASMIMSFAEHFPEVHVVAVPGNHGRPASKHAGSHPKTNWDSVCYHITRLMVEPYTDNVTWNIPERWYAIDELFDGAYANLVVHGDQIIGSGGVFPINNTSKKIGGWIDAIEEEWQSLYFGHFHTYASGFHNKRKWFCNGCFPAGQMVLTPDGYQAIESIEKGDTVIDKDGEPQEVLDTFGETATRLFRMNVTGVDQPVIATPNHQIWTEAGWVAISDIKPGDRVQVHPGVDEDSIFLEVTNNTPSSGEPVPVYDLKVENSHSYVVNAVSVHNSTESDNEFARRALAATGDPVQRLQFWNRSHGFIADYPVYLSHGLARKKRNSRRAAK